ncbi:hypothetical protein MTO96_028308 [Rhipicephalus appendiculatus]
MEKLEALGYECADFSDDDDGPKGIGLLIGGDYLWDLATGRTVKLGKWLRAVETAAGWTVQGPVEGKQKGQSLHPDCDAAHFGYREDRRHAQQVLDARVDRRY